jgi:hypothetical protein
LASHHLPAAAARLLAVRKPDGSAEVLLRYLPFADEESIIEEIELTLAAVALREGRAEPALTKALTAEEPLSRGMAGAALARARAAEHQNAIRKLLLDPDATVRLRVGLAPDRRARRGSLSRTSSGSCRWPRSSTTWA